MNKLTNIHTPLEKNSTTRFGFVAIVGRSNVGKSTLLNGILAKKIAITSHKVQTTRHRILGIKTQDNIQVAYLDTPGFHQKEVHTINQVMNQTADNALLDADIILFVADANYWLRQDEEIISKFKSSNCPVVLLLNKVDLVKDKTTLLAIIDRLKQKAPFAAMIPLSAKRKKDIQLVEQAIAKLLPKGQHLFPDDWLTDRDDRFLIQETIREQLLLYLNQEIPYSTAVITEQSNKKNNVLHIEATIWVERKGQKNIVIGKQGEVLKTIGRRARIKLEQDYQCKVMLKLWVKIKPKWPDKQPLLQTLGIIS